MPTTFGLDDAVETAAPAAAPKTFGLDDAVTLPKVTPLPASLAFQDPFGASTLPADAPKTAQFADLQQRAKLLGNWRDMALESAGDNGDKRAGVMSQFNAQRDKLNAEADAKQLPFNILKSDPENLADEVKAASMSPEDLRGVLGDRAGRIVAPVERGVAQFAGGAAEAATPENLPLMVAPGALPEKLGALALKAIGAGMVGSGTIQTAKALAQGKPDQAVAGALTAALGGLGFLPERGGVREPAARPDAETVATPRTTPPPAAAPIPETIAKPETGPAIFSLEEAAEPTTPAATRIPDNAPPPEIPEGHDLHSTPAGLYLYDPDRITPEEIDQALPVKETPSPETVTMYHGGSDPTGELNGPRDVTPYYDYAAGYAAKSGGKVWSVQVPSDAPFMKKAYEEFPGGPKAPWVNTVAPAEIMKTATEAEPLTPASEPANVETVAPETDTVRTAAPEGSGSGTVEEQASIPPAAGMTAEAGVSPVRSATELSSGPARVSRAEAARPFDLLDHIEANVGKIDPALIREANPDWRPVGAARKIFEKGGTPADVVATRTHEDGMYKGDPGQVDQLGDAINAAAQARKGWRSKFYQQERDLNLEGRQQSAFERQANRPGTNKETLVPDALNEGDEFELQGEKIKVKALHFDENGDVSHVELEDGKKFGTRQVSAGTVLHVDKGTVKATPPSTDFVPPEQLDRVESFLTKAIKATDANSSQLMEGVSGAPVWMTKAAVNLTLKAALHTYRGTKNLAAAIERGLQFLRAQKLSGYDEAQAREWLKQNLTGGATQPELGDGKVLGGATADRKPITQARPDEWSGAKGQTAEPLLADLHSAFTGEGFRQRAQAFKTWLGGLAGESFPKTTAAAREVGEQMARWVSSRMAALPLADGLVDDVTRGLDLDDNEFGAMLHEDNLRSIKQGTLKRAAEADAAGNSEQAFKLRRSADKVFTFIGKNGVWKDEPAYQNYLRNPRVQEAVARYKDLRDKLIEPMYREAMRMDPTLQLEPRGLQTGARINLNWVREGEASGPGVYGTEPVKPGNPTPRGVLSNVLVKKSPFGRVAKGTAAAYRPSFRDSIRNTYARQLEIANRNKFDRLLTQSGNALVDRPGLKKTIQGEQGVPFEQRRTMIVRNNDGQISRQPVFENIYVRRSLAPEYRRALNVDESWANRLPVISRFNKLVNGAALAGITDVTAHISNLSHALLMRPGVTKNLWGEIGLSVLGRADFPIAVARALGKFSAEDKGRLRELAEIGALREEHGTNDALKAIEGKGAEKLSPDLVKKYFAASNPMHLGAKLIQLADTRTRLQLDRMFSNLADQGLVPNTPTARREFVNQIGQYNKRAQGPMIHWFRDTGIGPFVTAGRAFNVLGVRSAMLHPGAPAATFPARLALAAGMASKIVGVMTLIGTLNYLLTKDKGGGALGRPGTRLGAVDLGISDKNGRPLTMDLANLLGLGRAARVTGIRGALEATRNNLPIGDRLDSAGRDVVNSWISPFAGPIVRASTIAATGFQPAIKVPPTAPVVPPGQSQLAQNLETAATEMNPIVAGIHDSLQPGSTGWELLQKQAGRFTLQPGKPPSLMANYAHFVDLAQLDAYLNDVIQRARKMEPSSRMDYLRSVVTNTLQPSDRETAVKKLQQRGVWPK